MDDKSNLVGALEHVETFPFHIWDVILPIDGHPIIFQDGRYTTNQYSDLRTGDSPQRTVNSDNYYSRSP